MAADPTKYFDVGNAAHMKLLTIGIDTAAVDQSYADLATATVVEHYTLDTFRERTAFTTRFRWSPSNYADATPAGSEVQYGLLRGAYRVSDYVYVVLRGYKPDASTADSGLALAMLLEVARVINWWRAQLKRNPLLESISAGEPSTSQTFVAGAGEILPPGFGSFLSRYAGSAGEPPAHI